MNSIMRYSAILFLIILLAAAACNSNKADKTNDNENKSGKASIEFAKLVHDFGKIEEGEMVACVFTFKNTGDSDLLIKSATTSCGCTVPEFDDEPISPGSTGEIEVVFDSSFRQGIQNKTITIRSNADQPVIVLKITAEVLTKN